MGMKLITGRSETAHVTAADDGALNAGIVGAGRYVLPVGNQFEYELLSNNLLRIKDGYALDQGRLIGIRSNDYEELTIENGITGTKRSDLIVARYEQNTDTGIETCTLQVIKGISGDTPTDPDTIAGNILEGANTDDFPLYRINIDGINVTGVEKMFETICPIQDDSGWTSDGITVEGAVSNTLQYRKIGNKVYWKGLIVQSNSITIEIPEAITPTSNQFMSNAVAINSGGYSYVAVFTFSVSTGSSITVDHVCVGTVPAGPRSIMFNGSYLLD